MFFVRFVVNKRGIDLNNRDDWRTEHFTEYIKPLDDLSKKPLDQCSLIDLGCGDGLFTLNFCNYVKYVVGIDINKRNIIDAIKFKKEKQVENCCFFVENILNMKFYNLFDIVISMSSFHYIKNKYEYINRMMTALKSGGVFILETNNKFYPSKHVLKHMELFFISFNELKRLLDQYNVTYDFYIFNNFRHFIYRLGSKFIGTNRFFWNFSTGFLVVGVKNEN